MYVVIGFSSSFIQEQNAFPLDQKKKITSTAQPYSACHK